MADVAAIHEARGLVTSLAPRGQSVLFRVPLLGDEATWFIRAVRHKVVSFGLCPPDCFRYKKWKVPGPDHFVTPAGKPRHLFSEPVDEAAGQQTDTLARQVREYGELSDMPLAAVKEIEYVLDLAPRYLWIVGPGSVDPPRHVFKVDVEGNEATVRAVDELPDPPNG